MSQTSVGVRELKAHLSEHLRDVAAGKPVVVTDRGKPIARIEPVESTSAWDQLVAAGLIAPAPTAHNTRPLPAPIHAAGTVSDLVAGQRG